VIDPAWHRRQSSRQGRWVKVGQTIAEEMATTVLRWTVSDTGGGKANASG